MKNLKNKKGITLVALVITIVVLLILAMITIKAFSDNGIIGKAKEAKNEYKNSAATEEEYLTAQVDQIYNALDIATGTKVADIMIRDAENGLIYRILDENAKTAEVYGDRGDIEYDAYMLGSWIYNACIKSNIKIAAKAKINDNVYDVTQIAEMAFSGGNLEYVSIPSSITNICVTSGVNSFYGTTGLKGIIVSENNTVYSSLDGVLYNKNKTELLLYPSDKTETIYTIPDGIATISISNNNLETVNVPNSITSLSVFGSSLKNINVSEGNATYSSDNGVLFNKNKTEIIMYPSGKTETTYTIPSSVTTIKGGMSGGGFGSCTNLSSLTIPNNVLNVDFLAFMSWTTNQTINVWWSEGNKPEGWNGMWNMMCNATIVYAPQ